jgi:hypothetical protein
LAVEVLREPKRGQLKTIANKEPVFGGLRICTFKNYSPVTKITFFANEGVSRIFFVVFTNMLNETLSQKFRPYSILITQTKHESVTYCVLKNKNSGRPLFIKLS